MLLPEAGEEADLFDAYGVEAGGRSLRLNMVTSLDGRVTDRTARSGGLGGEGDREVFRTLRALADAILVGAGTARAEGYGPHRLRPDLAERRAAAGRGGPAPIVVVSRSLDMDYDSALFSEAAVPTMVLTCAASPRTLRERAAAAGTVVVAGEQDVDLAQGLRTLREQHGLRHMLCEGGPSLNAALLGAGLVDELCLTVSPLVVGAPGLGLLAGQIPGAVQLSLRHALEDDNELFLRYRVAHEVAG